MGSLDPRFSVRRLGQHHIEVSQYDVDLTNDVQGSANEAWKNTVKCSYARSPNVDSGTLMAASRQRYDPTPLTSTRQTAGMELRLPVPITEDSPPPPH